MEPQVTKILSVFITELSACCPLPLLFFYFKTLSYLLSIQSRLLLSVLHYVVYDWGLDDATSDVCLYVCSRSYLPAAETEDFKLSRLTF